MEEIQPILNRSKRYFQIAGFIFFVLMVALVLLHKYDWSLGLFLAFMASSYNSYRLLKDTYRTLTQNSKTVALYAFAVRITIFALIFSVAFIVSWINEWVMLVAFGVLHLGFLVTIGTGSFNNTEEGI